MPRSLELVENLKQVTDNARRFQEIVDGKGTKEMYGALGYFSHWYYFRDMGVFAPSKFIGYRGTTVSNYEGGHGSAAHGGKTKNELKKWFKAIEPEEHHNAVHRWLRVAGSYVQGLGIRTPTGKVIGLNGKVNESPTSTGRIHILEEEFDELCHERTPNVWMMVRELDMEWVAGVVAKANNLLDSRHAAIGPSYFMKEGLDEDAVERIWKHSVMPYIEEHLFGEPDRLDDFRLEKLRNRHGKDAGDGATDDVTGPDDDE